MVSTAIVLAGGAGTRLHPLTETTPKPLLPLSGKPILGHIITNLKKHGIKNIILSLGYKASTIQNYFKDGADWGVKISYAIEHAPLGTGGALKQAAKNLNEPFLAFNGDNLADFNIAELIAAHTQNRTKVTLTLFPVEDVTQYGIAQVRGNKIERFIEKPRKEEAPSNLNNAGAYLIDPAAIAILPEGPSSIERDCFEKLAPLGEVGAFIHQGQWFPTDTIEKYRTACEEFHSDVSLFHKKAIIADVDDTICPSCQKMKPEMAAQINRMIERGYEFAFISGTKAEHLHEMVSSSLTRKHHILATTGTTYVHVNEKGERNTKYAYNFTPEEKAEITTAVEKLVAQFNIIPLTSKEDQLQQRDSQVTLSALGRNAPTEIKAAFDPQGEKRKVWIEHLKTTLGSDKYEMHIGGTTSIDITKKGLDKEWGIREFARYNNIPLSSIIFIGDKIFPGGNDYAAARVVDCISVRNPEHALEELKKIEQKKQEGYIEQRPWGKFEQFTHNDNSTVKILHIQAGKRISLQAHQHREEWWMALDNGALVEIDGKEQTLSAGQKVCVPRGVKHRITALQSPVRILEIARGNFDESDSQRFEDDFGRA